ncbi:AAK AK-HSDH: amino acid kinase superfamily aak domain-containing protein [Plakobranchus ocellatus]|uniref:AAK AK-HSDH: amino acid kinase superfamily aak domain-containing protein n=1 Tax=Plakobranchus ocellatus TaxID=259542 RepID=A0AAV4C7R0_9GAST|nr:AAK AK-HSDH: amino acid kinase superfamily aak domain-containing protein [Plakobranchus ocellatus]
MNIKSREAFINFNSSEDRVDQLLFNEMGSLSLARGFSENKMALDRNMGEKTLIARRAIKDYVISIGGIEKFKISENLLKSCSLSNRRYRAFIEEKENCVIKSSKSSRGRCYWP